MKKLNSNPVYVLPSGSVDAMEALGKDHLHFDEQYLQNLLAEHTELLPVYELRPDIGSLLCVGREVALGGVGTLDNLYLSTSGYPVIVEAKLWRNAESRRKVLAQVLDYLKEIAHKDFDWFAAQWNAYQAKRGKPAIDMITALRELADEEIDETFLLDRVNRFLESGEILALIVGDGIETRLQELMDFLCQDSAHLRYALALVQLTCYRFPKYDPNGLVIVPQIVRNVEPIQRSYIRIDVAEQLTGAISVSSLAEPERPSPKQTLSEFDFLQSLEEAKGRPIREEIEEFYSGLANMHGLEVEPTATSLMLKLPHPTGDSSGATILGIEKNGRIYNPRTLRFLLKQWQLDSGAVEEIVTTYWKGLHNIDQRFALNGLKPTSTKGFPPFEDLRSRLPEILKQVGSVVSVINAEFDDED